MSFRGIDISPYWRILPPFVELDSLGPLTGLSVMRLEAGPGFGVGTHETTQLCMLALGHLLRSGPCPSRVLDFGSGSGILAIGAALSGARVDAIECDAPSVEHAKRNARLNAVEDRIEFHSTLPEMEAQYDLVLANILNQILLDHAEVLCARMAAGGKMILSGLFPTDVPGILARFRPKLACWRAQIFERGTWRAVMFVPTR